MGYFANAFVFSTEPDWQKLSALAPEVSLLALKHSQHPLWLLTFRPKEEDEPAYPFQCSLIQPLNLDLAPAETGPMIAALSLAAAAVTADEYYGQVILGSALTLGFAMHALLQQPIFYFAANDDGLNLAFQFDDAGLARCKIEGYDGNAELIEGRVLVKPMVLDGEEEYSEAESIAENIGEQALITVEALRVVNDDEWETGLFSVPQEMWPEGWADPAAALGFGTWDILADYPQAWQTSYARL